MRNRAFALLSLAAFAAPAVVVPAVVVPAWGAEVLDRIAVTIDKFVIAESDVIRYLRVAAFLDGKPAELTATVRRSAAAALVDRHLILQESEDSHFPPAPPEDAQALLKQLKAQYATEAAYQAALKERRISEQDLMDQLLAGIQALRFTELRFRPEVQISDAELSAGYEKFAADWRTSHTGAPPSLEDSRADLEKLLTEQRATQALDQWLETTRAKKSVEYREAAFQ
jgi:hypothetical protein